MEKIMAWRHVIVFGNPVQAYLFSAAVFCAAILMLGFIKHFVFARLKKLAEKTPGKADDMALEVADKTILPLLYVGAFYFAAKQLVLNPAVNKLIEAVWIIALTVQAVRLSLAFLVYFLEENWFKKEVQPGSVRISRSILSILKVILWGFGIVVILDNLGFNVSAIVAGLGITGIAVALAAQTILGDLFNYFVIFFDRPFEEGDFIVFDNFMGEIENIGIKSTRVRSLNGELIVISNTGLISAKIRNYKHMAQRRVTFEFGVVHETTHDKLEKIPQILRSLIESQEKTRFERAHFQKLEDFGLRFEVVYYVLGSDYNQYMDIQQKINLGMKETFEKEGIEFVKRK